MSFRESVPRDRKATTQKGKPESFSSTFIHPCPTYSSRMDATNITNTTIPTSFDKTAIPLLIWSLLLIIGYLNAMICVDHLKDARKEDSLLEGGVWMRGFFVCELYRSKSTEGPMNSRE